jgi:hypothetical protein
MFVVPWKTELKARGCAEPLSKRRKLSIWPSTGVPEGALIVSACACAVVQIISAWLMSGDRDDGLLEVNERGLIRLFAIVCA